MAFDTGGILLPTDIVGEQYNSVSVFTQQKFVNQYPLISRVPRMAVRTNTFKTRHKKYRPQSFVVGATLNNTDTYSVLTLTNQTEALGNRFGDSTTIEAGDMLDLVATGTAPGIPGERVEVIATPTTEVAALPKLPTGQVIPAAGTVLVRRGAEGTTVTTHATTDACTLIGNSRNGGEVFQSGIRATPLETTQYVQNFMFPVQVSGSAQSSEVIGIPDLFAEVKAEQLENMMRDMEKSSFYGIGEAPGVAGQLHGGKQKGLRVQLPYKAASSPTNYLPSNFVTDALVPIYANNGDPDIMFCSPDVLAGLDSWGQKAERLDAGSNKFGLRITAYQSSIAPAVTIIPCTTLKAGTIVLGREDLISWRNKRDEFWNPRGIRGDAWEGDWIAEGAIEARDVEKWLWLEGIQTFGIPA